MTSWILVSSRWVAGSSTGTRQVSARVSTKRLPPASSSEGAAVRHASLSGCPSIPVSRRSPVARARTVKQRKSAGSAKAATVTSRLAPMPSKLDPVSSAASTSMNRPSASSPAKATRSPGNCSSALRPSSGRRKPANTVAAVSTTGPKRKSRVVVVL